MGSFLDKTGLSYFWKKITQWTIPTKPLTKAEYNSLSEEEKMADVAYIITDDAAEEIEKVRGWSNQNLLDNWYWLDPINQKGQTEYTEPGYTIDRWRTLNDTIVQVSDGGVSIESIGNVNRGLIYYFEDLYELRGKQLTFSVLSSGGDLYSMTFVSGAGDEFFVEKHFDDFGTLESFFDETQFLVGILPYNGVSKTFVAAKLEFGPTQTLTHQDKDGNWVLNDPPPNKALELAKCQRYMLVLPNSDGFYAEVGWGSTYTSSEIIIGIPTPVSLRAKPAVQMYGDWFLYGGGKSMSFNASNRTVQLARFSKNIASIYIGGFSGFSNLQTMCLVSNNSPTSKIVLDANL